MSKVNQVNLTGYVGYNPKSSDKSKGKKSFSVFSLGVNESYEGKDGEILPMTTWVNVTCYGELADKVNQSVKKGMQVNVLGQLRNNKYTCKDENNNDKVIQTLQVLANKVESSKKSDNDENDS